MRTGFVIAGAVLGAAAVWWVGDHYWYNCSDLLKACAVIAKP